MSIAHRHSRDMAAGHRVYHDSSYQYQVSGWQSLADNVGRGGSADQVHRAFMNSSEHRSHILDRRFNQIGTGAVRGSDGYLYVTEVFAQRGRVSAPSATRTVRRPSVRPSVRHRAVVRRRRPARSRAKAAAPAPRVLDLREPDRSVGLLLRLIELDP